MSNRWSVTAAAVALLALAGAAQAGTVYSNNFDSALGAEWTGIKTITGVQGFASLGGFDTNMLRNSSTGNPASKSVLTLTGLAAHSTVSLEFLLAIIDSWDYGGSPFPAPDYFVVRVGNGTTMSTVFHQFYGSFLVDAAHPSLGFSATFADQGYDLGTVGAFHDIAHSSSTLVVEFYAEGGGWQGGTDESWGIDNLVVKTGDAAAVVPVPPTAFIGLGLLAGIAALRRNRRREDRVSL